MGSEPLADEALQHAANTIRMLAADAVQEAGSGHPGMPMGAADFGAVLFLEFLRFNPEDPGWLNRDRFVLSNGHGSMFLYAILHLAGYEVTLDDLKAFRQWDSKTAGHPESFLAPGVECTTGPLGQGISNAVGMALGSKLMDARYNSPEQAVFDHRVFCIVGDGCLMEGVSSEASSLAGHWGLGNLIVLYDDNSISIAGNTDLAFTENVTSRYESYGWQVLEADGHNFREVRIALQDALAETNRPSLIRCKTIIGKGSPNKANTSGVHGAALGPEELVLTKKALDWPLEPKFFVPEAVRETFRKRVGELKVEYQAWGERFSAWKSNNPEKAQALEQQLALSVPENFRDMLLDSLPGAAPAATRKLSGSLLQTASAACPALIGGSADLEPSTLTLIKDSTDVTRDSFKGKNIRFGVREHGMGAIMNGLSYYGGFVPYGSTFLCFADYMKPAIRLAALSHLPGLFIFTHDSIFLGEDGPTHQPVEHVASLRIIPNLWVFRPADGVETAFAYDLALRRTNGPSALVLTRQSVPPLERDTTDIDKGAYTVYESGAGKPELLFVASGSEVSLSVQVAKALESKTSVRVVSVLCWELLMEQSEEYRENLVPAGIKAVALEAGTTTLWAGMLGLNPRDTLFVGVDRFGASAPAKVLAEKFGFEAEQVIEQVKSRFSL